MVKVSVLMPVYNAELYLAEAIESILSQNYEDWELIILNDGSTDRSEEIVLSYQDDRIKYAKNTENRGLIYTRNKLIESATGEYIAFLDSDDISYAERLSTQVMFLDNNPDYGVCGTWAYMIDDEGKVIQKMNLPSDYEYIRCTLLFNNVFTQSSIMIRRQILLLHSYSDHFDLAEDYDLWCRLSSVCKVKNLPEHLTKYRWHETNISKSKKDRLEELVRIIYRRELGNIGIVPTERELSIHSAIRDKSVLDNTDFDSFLKELREWLRKLCDAALDCGHYDRGYLKATIAFRWIFACKAHGRHLKALNIPIPLSLREYYLLLKILKERI